MSKKKRTLEQVWDMANEIRGRQLGEGARPLKYKTWKVEFTRSLKRADSQEHWLGIWEMYWTHPAYKWWRTTPELPHAAFFRAKNWPMWEDAYDEMKHKGVLVDEQRSSTSRVNTDTPGMAKTFWRTHQREAQKAMNEGRLNEWLDSVASNPNMVREMAGLRAREAKP